MKCAFHVPSFRECSIYLHTDETEERHADSHRNGIGDSHTIFQLN